MEENNRSIGGHYKGPFPVDGLFAIGGMIAAGVVVTLILIVAMFF